jgi:hypothetical protein
MKKIKKLTRQGCQVFTGCFSVLRMAACQYRLVSQSSFTGGARHHADTPPVSAEAIVDECLSPCYLL